MTERFGAGQGDYYGGPSRGRGASWVSVVIGWLSALGASLTLSWVIGGLISSMRGGTLPGLPENITQQGLNASLTLSSVLALLLPFVAGALGGARGAATGSRRP